MEKTELIRELTDIFVEEYFDKKGYAKDLIIETFNFLQDKENKGENRKWRINQIVRSSMEEQEQELLNYVCYKIEREIRHLHNCKLIIDLILFLANEGSLEIKE